MDEYINIGRWFSVLHRRSQIFVVEACEKLHLTYSEYVMLLRIYDHEGARQDDDAREEGARLPRAGCARQAR